MPRRRTTQRYRTGVYWACENFTDLKRVEKAFRCSPGFIYQAYYEKLSLNVRRNINYPFPSQIGIDEHVFGRKKDLGKREFVTMVVDHNKKRLREVTLGKSHADLYEGLKDSRRLRKILTAGFECFCFHILPSLDSISLMIRTSKRLLRSSLMRVCPVCSP